MSEQPVVPDEHPPPAELSREPHDGDGDDSDDHESHDPYQPL